MKSHWVVLVTLLAAFTAGAGEQFVYFGTYTGGKSKGIYVSRFDTTTGKLSEPELAAETKNPSFLAVHPTGKFLYVVGEVNDTQGQRAGAVNAYAIATKTGKLTSLNQQTSGGTGPCHLAVDASGQCVLIANYGSGSVAALPIQADGRLSAAASVIQHAGSSVNPKRQAGSHAHFITPSPDNRFELACDLGLDKILIYQLDAAQARLTTNTPPYATVVPGVGPRHLVFRPNGKSVYVLNEMALTITVFDYDAATARFSEKQTVATVPASYAITEKDSGAEIAIHPNGKYVYASNRGPNDIAVLVVDELTGKLTLIQNESTQGKTPRHFAIDPSGRWLLAENQNSDSVIVFALDSATGRLKPSGHSITVSSPVCAVFVEMK
jgi:6-phosphogluconolactonase